MISFLKKVICWKPLLCFLYKVSVFSVFLLCLVAILGYMADEGLKKCETHEYKRWADLQKPIEADLLIVGNSRAGWQVDPLIVDSILHLNSYNLGLEGGLSDFSEVIWCVYRRHNKTNPKLIVCNVDFVFFGNTKLMLSQILPPLYGDACFNSLLEAADISFADLYIPGAKYLKNRGVLNRGLEAYFSETKREEQPDNVVFRKGAVLLKTKIMIKEALTEDAHHFNPNRKRIEMFCCFLDECRVDNIPVVLMKTPIHPMIYPELTGLEESFTLIDSLATTRGLPLLDYTNYLIEDTTCFMDPVHLNYKGAQLLSVKLAGDLDSLATQLNIKL